MTGGKEPRSPAVFLDRDGTIVDDVGYGYRAEDMRFLDGAVAGLRALAGLGLRLFIVTNQSGVARGYFSEAQAQACNVALCRMLAEQGVAITGVYYCPFHPDGLGRYRCDSPLRKPQPGMLLQAAAEHGLKLASCWMIGDKKSDILAGQAAGCRTILVRTGAAGSGEAELLAQPDYSATDLVEAARVISDP
jgi:D-glycero-D-manno-heptose 1,7-bisphosphate phosphatase